MKKLRVVPQQNDPIASFRIPKEMKLLLEQACRKSGRSLPQEILLRLSTSLNHDVEHMDTAELMRLIFKPTRPART